MGQKIPQSSVFAVIDLGSNSFHMLIARHVAGGVHTIGRVKRKVRLAAGLDKNNMLSEEAMQRGWECLALFAERLQDIPKANISIVATATLRLAKNAEEFKTRAEQILNHKINVISGELEAKTIYKGVAHTSACQGRQLVIDIGGASTEVVIGKGFDALLYKSLNMGCVTFLEQYFSDGLLSSENFDQAIISAKKVVSPIQKDFVALGWELAIGASGTVQAIQEILAADGQSDLLTLKKLHDIQAQAIACQSISKLDLPGLSEERRLVFVSGLAILIALFESLHIAQMGLAGGALREGVLYSMIPELHNSDICKRTLDSFMDRYHVDKRQASYVAELALSLAKQLADTWQLDLELTKKIISAVACVHEIGLIVDYKLYHKHSAYILTHTGMPGYSKIEKQMIVALTSSHRADLNLNNFANLGAHTKASQRLSRIVRLAVILSMRRQDDMVPPVMVSADAQEQLVLSFKADWLANHPLMESELQQEAQYQRKVGWNIQIKRD
ncbi:MULTISPECIES: guanosine-5'-triphosphate,3'-diphosphate diphosphatase [Pseudoalteromonas]|uniref:Guanosine-5'-triphosphate,3'-diphosphate pyrophosphatase n=1 Tax=Pseudoalteromonas amylolytica TaxID=1859457 RepID=A0A1S1N1P1_9GAMM|nr:MULTISPECIES: guanosine-5'-triphosphate,3'-diphosphate diphosphatase [Pseudoalteromonas]OHU84569.1 guanosine-5'-triphosphate,3'-diphosphate pyrophosphatase [Pseudoalteromonas sp. JW3]OHU92522.1 guanosine-5'-triphosphate,3'-diphosphate pyrophosphatase [Pseudoalteromonas amylolytica]